MEKLIKISVLVLFVILIINACKKEEIDNPTSITTAVFNPNVSYGTMTDQDGNVYKTVTIGTQTWMAENLRTTKYRDGTAIQYVTDNTAWTALTTGAYCTYNKTTKLDSIATFGRLYNWYAVNTGKLCPTGWHVPSDAEWTTLTTYLGGETIAVGKLKETGTMHWSSDNTGTTNETGFTALPGGYRGPYGEFARIGDYGYWWSATEFDATRVWYRGILYDFSDVARGGDANKLMGLSVRCLRN